MSIARRFLVAATFEKANIYVFAGMMIHNPKVGGSIPPPATISSIDSKTYVDNSRLPGLVDLNDESFMYGFPRREETRLVSPWGILPRSPTISTIKAFSDYCLNTQVAIQALYISEETPVNHGYSKKSKDQESRNLCLTRLESYQLIIPLH